VEQLFHRLCAAQRNEDQTSTEVLALFHEVKHVTRNHRFSDAKKSEHKYKPLSFHDPLDKFRLLFLSEENVFSFGWDLLDQDLF
jgi:hypothetical protein